MGLTRTRIIIAVLTLTLLVGVAVIAYIGLPSLSEENPAPKIELESLSLTPPVTVSVAITGVRVTRAELWADDQLIARETYPGAQGADVWNAAWRWEPPRDGVYSLAVRAFDAAGRYGAATVARVTIPPNARIIFASNRDEKFALYAMSTTPDRNVRGLSTTGSSPIRLTASASDAREPSVSRAGRLAFAAGKDNAWHILTRALDSTTTLDLTSDLAFARRPVFSPDGTRLAFEASDGAGHTNVFIASADGSNRAQITQASSYDGQATWSPSNPGLPLYSGEAARAGTDLAIAVEQNNQWDIYTIRADGSNLTRLTSDPAQDWQPAWSPRGDKIAFVSNRGGTFQIYTMAPDGSSVTRLTDFPVGAEQPAWSPDGRWLAFVAYTGDGQASQRREICLMMADGRGLVRLTQNAWEDTEPTWGQ